MTGPILRDTVIERCLPVIRGVAAEGHVLHLELIFPVSTVRKKMFTFKVYTVENTLGWASLISTLKEHSYGATEHRLTFITGRNTSQTTFMTRTVFILLGSFKVISTNGMMSIVQIATNTPAKKVHCANIVQRAN